MSLAIAMKVSSGERRKFIVLFMDSVQICRAALFANTRKVTASECQVNFFSQIKGFWREHFHQVSYLPKILSMPKNERN